MTLDKDCEICGCMIHDTRTEEAICLRAAWEKTKIENKALLEDWETVRELVSKPHTQYALARSDVRDLMDRLDKARGRET